MGVAGAFASSSVHDVVLALQVHLHSPGSPMPKLPASRTKVPLVTRAMRTLILALLFLAASTRQAFAAETVSPAKRAMRGRFPFRAGALIPCSGRWPVASARIRNASPQLQGPLATNLA